MSVGINLPLSIQVPLKHYSPSGSHGYRTSGREPPKSIFANPSDGVCFLGGAFLWVRLVYSPTCFPWNPKKGGPQKDILPPTMAGFWVPC